MTSSITVGYDWLDESEAQKEATAISSIATVERGYKWGTPTITWSAPLSSYGYIYNTPAGQTPTFTALSAQDVAEFSGFLAYVSSIVNINFVYNNTSSADIELGYENMTSGIGGYTDWQSTNGSLSQAEVYISNVQVGKVSNPGSYGLTTLIHEFGHALGFKHPGNYDSTGGSVQGPFLGTDMDTTDASVMSYNHFVLWNPVTKTSGYDQSYMPVDIAALLSMYGAAQNISFSTFTYSFSETKAFAYSTSAAAVNIFAPFYLYDTNHKVILDFSQLNDSGQHLTVDLRDDGIFYGGSSGVEYDQYNTTTGIWSGWQYSQTAASSAVFNTNINSGTNVYEVIGSALNDTFIAGSGTHIINGGGGVDTIDFSSPSTQSIITVSGSSITISQPGTNDTIANIQNVVFSDTTIQSSWLTEAAALPPANFASLTEMYLAYFNRAPDSLGLDYWASRLSEGMSLPQIAASFSVQSETVTQYPANLSTQSFVTDVYQNVLGRTPDTAGFNYWIGQLQNGAVSQSTFILAIINGAQASTGSSVDAAYLSNKEVVGAHFAITDGLTDTTQAHAVMNLYNSTYATSGLSVAVTAANHLSDIYLAGVSTHPELVVQLVGVATTG